MQGDDRVRFCGSCRLHVYNLSAMSRTEAQELVAATEGRRCVRFYIRKDGTVLTSDCPVGVAVLGQRLKWIASAAAALLLVALAFFMVGWTALRHTENAEDRDFSATMRRIYDRFFGQPEPAVVMGEICVPALPPAIPDAAAGKSDAKKP
jgi:hypothetical protein